MIHGSLSAFRRYGANGALGNGPFAVVVAEDRVELASTLQHLLHLGFAKLILLAPEDVPVPDGLQGAEGRIEVVRARTRIPGMAQDAVNALIELVPGQWIHYCYNAEYLHFPFCEHRTIGEAVAFVVEERRYSVLTYVIDLYSGELDSHPTAVSLDTACLDSSGYYAETRRSEEGEVMERQLNFYGGLRWRFEEHVAPAKRRIDRAGIFLAKPGLRLLADHTLNDQEMNTYECPWHHSLTAAICSFRVAKALRANPGSRDDITNFRWHKSVRFDWSSQQLMDLGLMEPGQWF